MAGLTVHHLNCGTMHPIGGRLVDPQRRFQRGCLACHCLLIETPTSGLVLVDTGLGAADVASPNRFPRMFRLFSGAQFVTSEPAIAQLRAAGHDPADVRHIVMTHLDLDHTGGLGDFPDAQVHVHERELTAATGKADVNSRLRHLRSHFAHEPKWVAHEDGGEVWREFPRVTVLDEIDPDIALIPLPGHSRGHCGVAVQVGDRWLLHAGDCYYHRDQLSQAPSCPPGLMAFQLMMQSDQRDRIDSLARMRALAQDDEDVEIFCAHDISEFKRLVQYDLNV